MEERPHGAECLMRGGVGVSERLGRIGKPRKFRNFPSLIASRSVKRSAPGTPEDAAEKVAHASRSSWQIASTESVRIGVTCAFASNGLTQTADPNPDYLVLIASDTNATKDHSSSGVDVAGEVEFKGKGQALRLGIQQELGGGPLSIFGAAAQKHDLSIREVTAGVLIELAKEFPDLEFRQRTSLSKKEINAKLRSFDPRLGQALFVESASIRPDGAITEVQDRHGKWRVVLVGESKHQGNDVEKILAGVLQGKNKDQDFMAAGNAIERMHKNVLELRNFMLDERHFPYVVFLQGSNFATESFEVTRPDGRVVKIVHDSGLLNRIDRVTASSLSREINQNYCENIVVKAGEFDHMFQIASLFCQAAPWTAGEMGKVMLDVAKTSLKVLGKDLSIEGT